MTTKIFEIIIVIFTIVFYNINSTLCVCLDKNRFEMIGTNYTEINIEWLSNCSSAKDVNMSDNMFKEIQTASFINSSFRFKMLDLSNNKINLIETDALGSLQCLKHLYLHHNELVEIPQDFFKNKTDLITVDLSYNKIKNIPLTVFSNFCMPSLDTVLLQHNQLTAFEPWAYVGHPIRLVDASFNKISTFTNDHNWTYTRRNVRDEATTDLRYNSITEWHDWYVMQYKNQSEDRNDDVKTVVIELLLDIRENNLTCDCNFYNIYRKVRTSIEQGSRYDYLQLVCHDPPKLRGKLLFYEVFFRELVCNITDDCPVGCLCEDRPAEDILNVDCSGLNLTSMPSSVPRSPYNNIALQLDNNKISHINDADYLKYVSKLSMPNNFVTSLPDSVMNKIANNKDAFVDFRNNFLRAIPESTEKIKFQNALFTGNNLECSCNMIWMVDWIRAAPSYIDKRALSCTFEGDVLKILDLDESVLNCPQASVALIVILSFVLGIVVAVIITAKRCPYETKVLIFKFFNIHAFDKYKVDEYADKCYHMYVSFDDNDLYVRQWVMKVLLKQLERKKPNYKLSIYARNAPTGPETEARFQLIDDSKRILFILSAGYENHKWFDYEISHSETLEHNCGRIIYLLYDEDMRMNAMKEPWLSKMKERKVFKMTDRLLWAKLRYELPRK
ncbi:protein toll-like [Ruditapes philippinarum]|uniref:protein toll-like n=1 Tax=Ruditapes philippinarum TaxID=129788 RepID=UPI00295A91E8|nr:protein toll-like [Ruditapes philippinarum]